MFLQRALRHCAHHSIDHVPTLKEEQGRNTRNAIALGDGWMIIIKPDNPAQLDALLTAAEYEDYIKEEVAE